MRSQLEVSSDINLELCFMFYRDICKVTVLMQDLDEFSVMNQVYEQEMKKRFGDEPLPARTTSQAALVIRNAR